MPAEAEQVFAIVGDLDRLSEWMPAPIGVRPTGDGEVHADVESRDVHADGLVGVRPEQLRVEWGSEDSADYAGWLQVEHAEPGHSSVVMHLSFLGDQPETREPRPRRRRGACLARRRAGPARDRRRRHRPDPRVPGRICQAGRAPEGES